MIKQTFGIKLENQTYLDRIGSYVIIFNEKSQVATVKTKRGNFLIGGGIENKETHEECIRRECIEETGFDVEVLKFICKGETYCYADSMHCYFHPIGYFFLGTLKDKIQEPIETDHHFEWISLEEVEEKMYLEHQRWAIYQAKLSNHNI